MLTDDAFVASLREFMGTFMRRSMRNFIFFVKERELSMSQIGALFQINRGCGGVSEIGDVLGVTSAAASQILQRLVEQGYVLRSENPLDRRSKQIMLTDKGAQLIRDALAARQGWLDELPSTLSDVEKAQITAALNILITKVDQLEKQAEPEW
jgi:DNA-binding MarR family transcriptional regulator